MKTRAPRRAPKAVSLFGWPGWPACATVFASGCVLALLASLAAIAVLPVHDSDAPEDRGPYVGRVLQPSPRPELDLPQPASPPRTQDAGPDREPSLFLPRAAVNGAETGHDDGDLSLAAPSPPSSRVAVDLDEPRSPGRESQADLSGSSPAPSDPDAEASVRYNKLDSALLNALNGTSPEPLRVIIRTKPGKRAAKVRAWGQLGRRVHADHALIEGFTASVSAADMLALTADPDIERISTDAVVRASTEPYTSGTVLRETLGLLPGGGITSGGSSWAGDKVGVAVVDSGIEDSKDLKKRRVSAFYDFTHGGNATKPYDDYGHGTHVAGLIGGSGDLSSDEFEGAASKAHFVGLKVLDSTGMGYTSDVVAAIEFAIENKDPLGIDVMNLSLGHPIYEPAATDPLVLAVEQAVAAGIVVVVSAGNYGQDSVTGEPGYGGITSPGNAPSVITVGAVDIKNTVTRADDIVPVYSSRGPTWYDGYAKPDLVAPGHRLVAAAAQNSSLYNDHPEYHVLVWAQAGDDDDEDDDDEDDDDEDDGGVYAASYLRLSGTSMAAAVTSGVVAVMLEASQASNTTSLTPNAVKAILQFTALPLEGTDTLTQGSGSLNATGAVRLASAIDTSTATGELWLATWLDPVDVIGGAVLTWSQRLVWGNRIVWGNTIYANEPAWALRIVWGNRLVWGNRIVWGNAATSFVWGERLVWGNRIVWGNTVLGFDDGTELLYGDRIVWGNVTAERLVWGNLSDVTTAALPASRPALVSR